MKGLTKEELQGHISEAKKKLEQDKAREERREARRRSREGKVERARDTRRKILLGGLLLAKVKRGEWTEAQLLELASGLTRDEDRALFGLQLLASKASKG